MIMEERKIKKDQLMNKQELENVQNLDSFERYQYCVKKIADYEEVWTIIDKNGDFALSDIEDYVLISLWPKKEFITSNLFEGWQNCKEIKLDLDYLYDKLFTMASNEGYLFNIFPVKGKSGFIVSLEEFERDLNEELENYR